MSSSMTRRAMPYWTTRLNLSALPARPRIALVLLLVIGISVVGVVVLLAGRASHNSAASTDAEASRWYIYAVDSHGVVITRSDGHADHFVGVDRTSGQVWRRSGSFATVACVDACPTAILSGSASGSSALTPDPAPVVMGSAAKVPPLLSAAHRQHQILAAGGGSYVQYISDGTRPRFAILDGSRVVEQVANDSYANAWNPSDRATVAYTSGLSTKADGESVRFFQRTATGWRAGPGPFLTEGAVCASARPFRYVVDGGLRRAGRPTVAIAALRNATGCALVGDRVVATTNSAKVDAGEAHRRTELVVTNLAGRPVYTKALAAEYDISGDSASGRLLIAGMGRAAVWRVSDGKVLLTRTGVDAAALDDAGDLVIVDKTGRATWVPLT